MKRNIIWAGIMLASSNLNAQHVNWFQAEHHNYYTIKGCTPQSSIFFYSEIGGGKMLKSCTVDKDGGLLVREDEKFRPAFFLNRKDKNNLGASGTGMVTFINEKEFTFQEISISKKAGNVTIGWKAEVNSNEDISFEVMKSTDGVSYSRMTKVTANHTGFSSYSINDKTDVDALYQVRVVNAKAGLRYTSSVIAVEGATDIKLYPTAAGNTINVLVPQKDLGSSYKIISTNGQLVDKGRLQQLTTTISVSDLVPGNYYMIIQSQEHKASIKFLKL